MLMRKSHLEIIVTSVLVATLIVAIYGLPEKPGDMERAGGHYTHYGVAETGSINLVTAILFDYRGFDTLGEITVLLLTVIGVSLLFSSGKLPDSREGLSILVKRGVQILLPVVLLLSFYIMLFGHISPGGGFQGGVIIGAFMVLLFVTYGSGYHSQWAMTHLKSAESLAALGFIALGFVGILKGESFLTNLGAGFAKGIPGRLPSAGFIPYLNLISGIKVGAGLSLIFANMIMRE